MNARLRLMADDLSGALDTIVGLRLPAMDWPAIVTWKIELEQCVAISTDTRDAAQEMAVARCAKVAPWLLSAALPFKKIDSRLRGHVAAELAVLRRAAPDLPIVVAPAAPRFGRIMRGGSLLVRTGPEAPWQAEPVDLANDLSRLGITASLRVPGDPVASGVGIWDAETDADLDRIVEAHLGADEAVVWCGSSGLGAALGRQLGSLPWPSYTVSAPMLAIVGTRHPTMLAQVERLRQTRPEMVSGSGARSVARVAAALADGQSRLVVIDPGEGLGEGAAAALIRRAIGTLLDGVRRPGSLFVSGGATLQAVAVHLGADAIAAEGQYAHGVPWGRLRGGRWDGLPVVSKSGGFGDEGLLAELCDDRY
jgi:uncharacterized protein YgbK (DUF1537 family)